MSQVMSQVSGFVCNFSKMAEDVEEAWSSRLGAVSKSVYKSVVKSSELFPIFCFRLAQKRSNYFCLDVRFYCIGCHIGY